MNNSKVIKKINPINIEDSAEKIYLKNLSVIELKNIVKNLKSTKIKNLSKLKKNDLIDFILSNNIKLLNFEKNNKNNDLKNLEKSIIDKKNPLYKNYKKNPNFVKIEALNNVETIKHLEKISILPLEQFKKKLNKFQIDQYDGLLNELKSTPTFYYPVQNSYDDNIINNYRKNIYDTLINYKIVENPNNLNFKECKKFLNILWKLYDELFFKNQMKYYLELTNSNLSFKCSNKLTRAAGMCHRSNKCNYTITISIPLLSNFDVKHKIVSGKKCYSLLECLMLVFEHELIHLIIWLTGQDFKQLKSISKNFNTRNNKKIYGDHGLLFKNLAKGYFGHTKYVHQLNSNTKEPLIKEDVILHDLVKFSHGNINIIGKIVRKNSVRATIEDIKTKKRYLVRYELLDRIY